MLSAPWVNRARPATASASSPAVTVTVCAVDQLPDVKVSSVGLAVRSASGSAPPTPSTATVIVTSAVGSVFSRTVYVAVEPSVTVSAVADTVTPPSSTDESSSMMNKIASRTVNPCASPDTVTNSEDSTSASWTGVRSNVVLPLAVWGGMAILKSVTAAKSVVTIAEPLPTDTVTSVSVASVGEAGTSVAVTCTPCVPSPSDTLGGSMLRLIVCANASPGKASQERPATRVRAAARSQPYRRRLHRSPSSVSARAGRMKRPRRSTPSATIQLTPLSSIPATVCAIDGCSSHIDSSRGSRISTGGHTRDMKYRRWGSPPQ